MTLGDPAHMSVHDMASGGRRRPTRHNMSTYMARHHGLDVSSPFTSGSMNNLAPAQFHGMYVRNPIRSTYRKFMKIKSPYQKRRT